MNRYLEEAAEQLRKAIAADEKACDETPPGLRRLAERRERHAQSFTALAAIERGLLPDRLAAMDTADIDHG